MIDVRRSVTGIALAASLLASPAAAHEFGEERQVLVQVDGDVVEVLVAWRLGSSVESRMWDGLLDANSDGRLDGTLEELAATRALMPRALVGLGVLIDGVPPTLEIVRSTFAPSPRTDTTAGWEGGVLLRATLPAGEGCRELVVTRDPTDGADVRVDAAIAPGRVERTTAAQPHAENGPWSATLGAGEQVSWCVTSAP